MLSVAQHARLEYACFDQNWTAKQWNNYSLMNHGFAFLVLMQKFVFGVIVGIVMNEIVIV